MMRSGQRWRHDSEEDIEAGASFTGSSVATGDAEFLSRIFDNLTVSTFKSKIKDEETAKRFCRIMNMIPTKELSPAPNCPIHHTPMTCQDDKHEKLGWRYRCEAETGRDACGRKIRCKKSVSPLTNTFMNKTRITFQQMLLLILCFITELTNKQIAIEVHVTKKVVDWLISCREICQVIMAQPIEIGGWLAYL